MKIKSATKPLSIAINNILNYSHRLPILITIPTLLLVAGCDDSNTMTSIDTPTQPPSQNYSRTYPTLALHADMSEDDFHTILTYGAISGEDITPESIKSLSVGMGIDYSGSTFNSAPIFDLGRMQIDIDTTRSTTRSTLGFVNSKSSDSNTSQWDEQASVSFRTVGFKGSASQSYSSASANTESGVTTSIEMTYANTGNIVKINELGDDFSTYLLGTPLTDDVINNLYIPVSKVTYPANSPTCANQTFITDIQVVKYLQSKANPYVHIQLLGYMEKLLGDLRKQYNNCSDIAVRDSSYKLMVYLRPFIVKSITDFYAMYGDAYVDKVYPANAARGLGSLAFNSSMGNEETRWGVAASVKISGIGAGGSASGSYSQYKAKGYNGAFTNASVTAESFPSGLIDTTAWTKDIYAMLQSSNTPSVPPAGTLPRVPDLKLPDPVELLPKPKKPLEPPESVFSSYDDWKKYQSDKKGGGGQKDPVDLDNAQANNVSELSLVLLDEVNIPPNAVLGKEDTLEIGGISSKYLLELEQLRNNSQKPILGATSNLVRIDKMYVSGFTAIDYDQIIPQLRPNLSIPKDSDNKYGVFKNTCLLMIWVEKLGKLDTYLKFLSKNNSISRVDPSVSAKYSTFYKNFSNSAFDIITLSISQGVDIDGHVLNDFWLNQVGDDSSSSTQKLKTVLCKNLDSNLDLHHYIVGYLLNPPMQKIWEIAPGGYIPLSSGNNSEPLFHPILDSSDTKNPNNPSGRNIISYDKPKSLNPSMNPLDLYKDLVLPQSPWFPIYAYRGSQEPSLLFMQNIGPSVVIYGYNWQHYLVNMPTQSFIPYPGYQVMPNDPVIQGKIFSTENSFIPPDGSKFRSKGGLHQFPEWGTFSLYFPDSTVSLDQFNKYRIILLNLLNIENHSEGEDIGNSKSYVNGLTYETPSQYNLSAGTNHPSYFLRPFTYNYYNNKSKWIATRVAYSGSFFTNSLSDYGWSSSYGNVMLLPINSHTVGNDYTAVYSYGSSRTGSEIISTQSMRSMNKIAALFSQLK